MDLTDPESVAVTDFDISFGGLMADSIPRVSRIIIEGLVRKIFRVIRACFFLSPPRKFSSLSFHSAIRVVTARQLAYRCLSTLPARSGRINRPKRETGVEEGSKRGVLLSRGVVKVYRVTRDNTTLSRVIPRS